MSARDRFTLCMEQGALLWCLRTWVDGTRHDVGADRRIRAVFTALGAADAAPYLDGLMFAVAHGATRPIAIQPVCCPRISVDEQLLLDSVALAQELRPFEAMLKLRGCLTPEGARSALCSAEGVGAALARSGCFLPAPGGAIQRFTLAASSPNDCE